MPIYEYRRPDGSTFEIVQSFSDDPLTHDPDTGVSVQRVFHAPAVHFKGSGFYNTDYGTRKRQRESAASSASEGDGSAEKKDTAGGSGDGASNGNAGAEKSSGGESAKPSSDGAKAKDAKPVAAKA
jgi:putative FmdB family regulatory protein